MSRSCEPDTNVYMLSSNHFTVYFQTSDTVKGSTGDWGLHLDLRSFGYETGVISEVLSSKIC